MLHRSGADEYRAPHLAHGDNLVDDGPVFGLLTAVDLVGVVEPLEENGPVPIFWLAVIGLFGAVDLQPPFLQVHLAGVDDIFDVGRERRHVETVNLAKFLGVGHGRTGHAGELLIEAEVVLQGDRRHRHRLAFYLNAFLGLDCLVQAVGVAPAGHEPAGEVVHDDDLPVLYHVLLVAVEEILGLQGVVQVVGQVEEAGIIETLPGVGVHFRHAALDLAHGLPFLSPVNIHAGTADDYADAAVIVITAGAKQQPDQPCRLDAQPADAPS